MATANLSVESKDFTLPVVEATAGADGIVVSTLRNDGWVTLDPGFLTTAQCESKITYIDGKNSILRYRGYPIEQLCEQSDFLEVAWLLRHGELPNKETGLTKATSSIPVRHTPTVPMNGRPSDRLPATPIAPKKADGRV